MMHPLAESLMNHGRLQMPKLALISVLFALPMALAALEPPSSLGAEPPFVSSVNPSGGPLTGETSVDIRGGHLTDATTVKFGSTSATGFTLLSGARITYAASAPAVEALSRSEGREQGEAKIIIRGTGFIGATEVHFGSAPATRFVVNAKGTAITVVYPPAELVGESAVDVTVTTPEGTSPTTPADRFTYSIHAPVLINLSAHKGPPGGGTTIEISGEHFIHVTAVDFGSLPAASFTVNSSRSITATSPASTSGKVNVAVTTPAGVSGPGECVIFTEEGPRRVPCQPRDHFVFGEPTISNITPITGPVTGGTTVTITGTGFALGAGATAFHFGGAPLASSVDCTSTTTCTAVTPAHKPGVLDVKAKALESEVGASRLNPPADQFAYS